ncbi:MAG: HTTM domain-containing protein, partial [Planctomycetota bacterium]|nr:HTTM domain-containing protein [Planctomycetota bacterium]
MADASLYSAAKSSATVLQRIFGLDTRSLAIFRIVVGVLILIDLYERSLYLTDFYTDDGFLTRALLHDDLGHLKPPVEDEIPSTMPWPFWSFHLLSGDVWVAQMLFGLQALLAILLIIGWKTRLLTVLNWLLLISLHARNPIVLNSGDTILRMMLFWGIFLPLGRHWSFDRWRKKATQASASSVVSVASAAFIIQLCTMYWFTGWAKMNPTWLKGEAIHNVLNLNIVCRPLGKYLLEYPDLLGTMCHVTLWMEFGAPFLL